MEKQFSVRFLLRTTWGHAICLEIEEVRRHFIYSNKLQCRVYTIAVKLRDQQTRWNKLFVHTIARHKPETSPCGSHHVNGTHRSWEQFILDRTVRFLSWTRNIPESRSNMFISGVKYLYAYIKITVCIYQEPEDAPTWNKHAVDLFTQINGTCILL